MKIALIGLGKMGLMLAKNMEANNIKVFGHDLYVKENGILENIEVYKTIKDLKNQLSSPGIIWMMVPAGEPTESVFKEVLSVCEEGDIIVDAGNSHYLDSISKYTRAKEKNISFLDVGTSGGVEGALSGACMMVGGDREAFNFIEPILQKVNVKNGYLYCGEAGSGHYLKMVHNGIEYGMMEAISEGFSILKASQYKYNLKDVAKLFNHGSVIRGWLMELTEEVFELDNNLTDIAGIVNSSGEGRWTVEESIRLKVPAPIITQSLLVRYQSELKEDFNAKILASLRNKFGGHYVKKE